MLRGPLWDLGFRGLGVQGFWVLGSWGLGLQFFFLTVCMVVQGSFTVVDKIFAGFLKFHICGSGSEFRCRGSSNMGVSEN